MTNYTQPVCSADIEWELSEPECESDDLEPEPLIIEDEDTDIAASMASSEASISSSTPAASCSKTGQKRERSASPEITMDTPSPPASVNPTHSKATPSDWLQNIQWKAVTPQKTSDHQSDHKTEDSAQKKRAKYTKEGLAERLQKLVARENSSWTFWSHRLRPTASSESSQVLQVEVLSEHTAYSLMWARCRCVSVSNSQAEDLAAGQCVTVIFNSLQSRQLGILKGATVDIHPPWQKMRLQSGALVVLCTRFCQLVSQHGQVGSAQQQDTGQLQGQVH